MFKVNFLTKKTFNFINHVDFHFNFPYNFQIAVFNLVNSNICYTQIIFILLKNHLTCLMTKGSWTYDQSGIDLILNTDRADLTNYVSNGEWMLESVSAERHLVTYSCCPIP